MSLTYLGEEFSCLVDINPKINLYSLLDTDSLIRGATEKAQIPHSNQMTKTMQEQSSH